MAISSNTLFHFTKEFDTLIQILKSGGFWARYCEEYGWGAKENIDFAVPIACFCDIPLSQIEEHTSFYGSYGIGLSKEWAIANKHISPVFYLTNNSIAKSTINSIRRYCVKNTKLPKNVEEANYRFFSLIKKYNGKTKDKEGNIKIRTFYNEREWRYVPKLSAKDSFFRIAEKKVDLAKESEKTRNYLALFTPNDIKYLIVANENDRIELLKILDNIYGNNISLNTCTLLKSKILTCEQIKQDF